MDGFEYVDLRKKKIISWDRRGGSRVFIWHNLAI